MSPLRPRLDVLFITLALTLSTVHGRQELATKETQDSCPKIPALVGFDSASFSGKWFEVSKIPLPDSNQVPSCSVDMFTDDVRGRMVLYSEARDHSGRKFNRTGTLIAYNSPSQMVLLYSGDKFKHEYSVVSTDYDYYAIVYNCAQTKGERLTIESGSVLSRSPQLVTEIEELVQDEMKRLGVNCRKFRTINQTACD